MTDNMVRVTFLPEGRTVEFEYGTLPYGHHGKPMSFLDVAEHFDIFLDHACGGSCACTTCHLWTKEGSDALSPADDDELDAVSHKCLEERFALSVDGGGHATGVCWLSHSAILSPAARSSEVPAASRSRSTSSTA